MEKVLKILSYISISLFLFALPVTSQEKMSLPEGGDQDPVGFTVGFNLEGPVGKFFDSDKSAFSAVTHINLSPHWFFRGEAGFENLRFSSANRADRNYAYESNGSFLKAGILYDFFDVEEAGNRDNIFVGLHYGFALQEHGSRRFVIQNGYWDDFQGSVSNYVMNTHWAEFSVGPRTELLKNFYMGWTVNLRMDLWRENKEVLVPYSVPGFGRGDNNVNVGFSYVIEYFIPWGGSGR
ncbi:MAG: DUF6048 family protein [Marinilabiliaceae bacterium]